MAETLHVLAKAQMLTLLREIQLKLGFFLTHRAGASSPFIRASASLDVQVFVHVFGAKFGFGSVDAFLSKIQASTKKSFRAMKVQKHSQFTRLLSDMLDHSESSFAV